MGLLYLAQILPNDTTKNVFWGNNSPSVSCVSACPVKKVCMTRPLSGLLFQEPFIENGLGRQRSVSIMHHILLVSPGSEWQAYLQPLIKDVISLSSRYPFCNATQ